ncbi:MAG TPA: HIT family protein [Ktedonobacterales bacterium]|nr:HIT family protein [Ktedonobacterales bacterium]
MEPETADCVACQANSGEIVAPGGALYDDGLWRLEHTFEPIPMVGWLVLKPLRHVESLADLTPDEAAALGPLLRRITGALRETLAPARVYAALFAEGVAHLHIHLIPRAPDLPEKYYGPGAFDLLKEAFETGQNVGDPARAETVALTIKERLTEGGA